ncbi:MAG TPA: tRNA pseudouridine(38-40) synthase TruA [Balneolaceae bacterium]|nr:tRNA pseudouridine(38-40) synthase TruA [Balneolaceae bacterium]|tara:strand:- start:58182 stop:58925 length:744 start_codon:yes stop_codon:yes gene_type:complete
MPRYKLTIEYNGAAFNGWQIQPDVVTVEGEIEKALQRILQSPVDVVGQGRTDAGVHARGQTAHVDLPGSIDLQKLFHGVNGLVGADIQIVNWEEVSDDFHARFDAVYREYEYCVLKYDAPLMNNMGWWSGKVPDIEVLNEAAALIQGEHDFDGFSKFNPENYTTLCEVLLSVWEEQEGCLVYRVRANRFLRNMVRRLVGTMMEVATGKMSLREFEGMLKGEKASVSAYTAPAKGLVLQKVFYEKNEN